MRGVLIAMVFLVVGGCDRASWMEDGGACPIPPVADAAGVPDMATPAPKCAAAKGLAGDNLLCVDFKDVQQLTSLTGWNFFCGGLNSWTSSGGFLQVNNFSTFQDECTAKLPAINLNDADKLKYKSVALSLVHRQLFPVRAVFSPARWKTLLVESKMLSLQFIVIGLHRHAYLPAALRSKFDGIAEQVIHYLLYQCCIALYQEHRIGPVTDDVHFFLPGQVFNRPDGVLQQFIHLHRSDI